MTQMLCCKHARAIAVTRLLAGVVARAVAGDEVLRGLASCRSDRVRGVQVFDLVRQAALRLLVACILRGKAGLSDYQVAFLQRRG